MAELQLKTLKKEENGFQDTLKAAKENKDFATLTKARKDAGYQVEETPEVHQIQSPDNLTLATVVSYKLKKDNKEVGNLAYYKYTNEEGAISDLHIEGNKFELSFLEDGKIKSAPVEVNPELTEDVQAALSRNTCISIVTMICGRGVLGSAAACVEFCITTGPGFVVCSALCGILLGGGCFLGAATVCSKIGS
ncbi:hypothetical protein [Bacillus sp. Brlt_9]|uniref:hypothetical protein n=1 Tax=Bacillus sp. Brlt_9 TaxID=3110916 RepID=UPI003F7CB65F